MAKNTKVPAVKRVPRIKPKSLGAAVAGSIGGGTSREQGK